MSLASLDYARRRLQAFGASKAGDDSRQAKGRPLARIRAGATRAAIWTGAGLSIGLDWFASGLGPWIEALDSTAGWLVSALLAPLELFMTVPVIGRIVGMVWRGVLTILWGVVRIPESILFLLGLAPEKRLRLWLLVSAEPLSERQQERLDQAVEAAAEMLLRQANVRLVSIDPFSTAYPFSPTNQDPPGQLPAPAALELHKLKVGCLKAAFIQDLGRLGGAFDRAALRRNLRGAYRRLTGWGAPLMAVTVDSVEKGTLAGCSLGPLTDYVVVDVNQPICLAHEIGHACNLPHVDRPGNLMNRTCGGVHLDWWQAMLLRMSRHVTQL